MKKICLAFLFLSSIGALLWIVTWKSPPINWAYKKEIWRCIHEGSPQTLLLPSGSGLFEINFVRQAGTDCVNPHFPSIQIKTSAPHNAWIQVVYTDADDERYKAFVDAAEGSSHYPFYSYEPDFYDAPIWVYTLFSKPVHNWQAHAYAVRHDPVSKKVTCIGGISWGYKLSPFHLRPEMILPSFLSKADWKKDWDLVKIHLKDYTISDTF